MNSNLGHSVSSVSSISCLEKPQLHRIGFTLVDWEGVRLHFDFELNDRAVIGLRATLWSGVGRLWLDLVGFWQESLGLSSLQEFISWSLSILCTAARLLGMNACRNVCSVEMKLHNVWAWTLRLQSLHCFAMHSAGGYLLPPPPHYAHPRLCDDMYAWSSHTYMSIFRLGSLTR